MGGVGGRRERGKCNAILFRKKIKKIEGNKIVVALSLEEHKGKEQNLLFFI